MNDPNRSTGYWREKLSAARVESRRARAARLNRQAMQPKDDFVRLEPDQRLNELIGGRIVAFGRSAHRDQFGAVAVLREGRILALGRRTAR